MNTTVGDDKTHRTEKPKCLIDKTRTNKQVSGLLCLLTHTYDRTVIDKMNTVICSRNNVQSSRLHSSVKCSEYGRDESKPMEKDMIMQ